MADTSREVALKIKAEVDDALRALGNLQSTIGKTGTAGQKASEGVAELKRQQDAATAAAAALGRAQESAAQAVKRAGNEVDAAGRKMDDAGKRAQNMGRNLGLMIGAMATAFGLLLKSTIDNDLALGDLSKKVGVSTETLSALGDVARRNGADLHTVQQGFVNLARVATNEGGNAARALTAMGIPLKEFQQLTAAQQFDLVAQKFATYEDGANKAALATALFGQRGVELIPTLNQVGRDGLQNLTDKAIAAGTAVGGDAVDAATAFSDALRTLKEKLQGAANTLLVEFRPEIDHLVELINSPEFQQHLKDTAQGVVLIGQAALTTAGYLAQAASGLASLARWKAFGETGHIDQDQSAQAQNNQFQALLEKRQQIQSDLDRELQYHGDPKKNPLAQLLQKQLDENTVLMKAAQDEHKAAVIAKQEADAKRAAAATASKPATTEAPIVPGRPGRVDHSAEREAEKIAREAAKAQDQLTQSLIGMQGQLDPTAAIWAKYNEAVKNATAQAESAKRAQGANADAIDSQRNAVIGLAATIRDAALDKIADQDRQAWERLKDSLRTPVEVATDKAVEQLLELNRLMVQLKGTKDEISPEQYADTVKRIADRSVSKAPQYQGLDAAVGGIGSELNKNFRAQADLDTWHQEQLAANEKFRAKDEANEAAYKERLAEIDRQYTSQKNNIEQSRGRLALDTASGIFGQLATLSTSHNKKMAAIGKAASIAQAVIKTYESANDAYASLAGIPYIGPALGAAAAAAAIAAGLANVAQIRSQNVGQYAVGGAIRGPGTGTSDSVPILASNGEFMHTAAAVQYYGLDFMRAVNERRLPRFAEGGAITSFANVPSPAELGFRAPAQPRMRLPDAANDGGGSRGRDLPPVVILVNSHEQALEEMAKLPAFQKAVIQTVGDNPRAIQGKWGR